MFINKQTCYLHGTNNYVDNCFLKRKNESQNIMEHKLQCIKWEQQPA